MQLFTEHVTPPGDIITAEEESQDHTQGTEEVGRLEVTSQHSDDSTTSSKSKKKRKVKGPPMELTEEQKVDIAEWYRAHPILYNSKLAEFKNTAKKMELWKKKAEELQVDPDRLQTWVKKQRDTFGRLVDPMKQPSGSGAFSMSDADKWLMDNFGFLKDHRRVHTVDKRNVAGLKTKVTDFPPAMGDSPFEDQPGPSASQRRKRQEDDDDDDDDDDDEDDDDDASAAVHVTRSPSTSASTSSEGVLFKKKKPTSGNEGSIVSKLVESSTTLQKEMLKVFRRTDDDSRDPVTQSKKHSEFIYHETMCMSLTTWRLYQAAAMQQLTEFKKMQEEEEQSYQKPQAHGNQSQQQPPQHVYQQPQAHGYQQQQVYQQPQAQGYQQQQVYQQPQAQGYQQQQVYQQPQAQGYQPPPQQQHQFQVPQQQPQTQVAQQQFQQPKKPPQQYHLTELQSISTPSAFTAPAPTTPPSPSPSSPSTSSPMSFTFPPSATADTSFNISNISTFFAGTPEESSARGGDKK